MIRRRTFLLATASLAAFPLLSRASLAAAAGVENAITLRGGAGNYPVRIGRPFMRGEIAQAPQAVVGGAAVPTQADVKTRWPDGSVKHAILSFVLPRAAERVKVTFTN